MNVPAPIPAPAGARGMNHMRVLEVIDPETHKHHVVELEIGDRLWLKDSSSKITMASRSQLERTGWDLVQAQVAGW